MSPTDKTVIKQTQTWLETVIIAYNICPFASKVHQQKRIHYNVSKHSTVERALQQLMDECIRLDNDPDIATTLLIFPGTLLKFTDYLDFLGFASELLSRQGYDGIYQLASFHPNYCFADSEVDDPANYTNRSPYPMLHLIREDDIEQALSTYSNPEGIPERNISLTRNLGLAKMQQLLADCLNR